MRSAANFQTLLVLVTIISGSVAFTRFQYSALPLRFAGIAKMGIRQPKSVTALCSIKEEAPEQPSRNWNLCTPIRQGGDAAENLGIAAREAASKIGDAAGETSQSVSTLVDSVSTLSIWIQSVLSTALGFFIVSILQPVSKYFVFCFVILSASLPFIAKVLLNCFRNEFCDTLILAFQVVWPSLRRDKSKSK